MINIIWSLLSKGLQNGTIGRKVSTDIHIDPEISNIIKVLISTVDAETRVSNIETLTQLTVNSPLREYALKLDPVNTYKYPIEHIKVPIDIKALLKRVTVPVWYDSVLYDNYIHGVPVEQLAAVILNMVKSINE